MRKFTRGRFRGAMKRKGAWCGSLVQDTSYTVGTTYSSVIWGPADSERLNIAGMCTTRRTLLNFNGRDSNAVGTADLMFYWYLQIFQTDLTETAPSAIIWDPSSTDVDAQEKRFLASGMARLSPNPGGVNTSVPFNYTIERSYDVKSRHRMTNEDSLMFVWKVITTGAGTAYNLALLNRAYCSW